MSIIPLFARLSFEAKIFAKYLSTFSFDLSQFPPCFVGNYRTTAGGNVYRLKVVPPEWYPNDMPSLYVIAPNRLTKYGDKGYVNDVGISHAYHTMENGPGGCVQICHFNSDTWDASKTCIGVATKGIMWCEAYDCHLATGRTIADILDEFRRRI
ncbi:MAG: hypothetical protein ABIK28_10445 [Planctomycetota bacterium]